MAALRLSTRWVISVAALALTPARVVGTAPAPLLPEGVAAPATPAQAQAPSAAPEARTTVPSRTNRMRACDMCAPLVGAPGRAWCRCLPWCAVPVNAVFGNRHGSVRGSGIRAILGAGDGRLGI